MDQQRLAELWRAGIGANACALAATVLAWSAPDLIGWWAIVAEGVLLVAVAVAWHRTRPRPLFDLPRRAYSDRDRGGAIKRLLRGEPVDPPALRAEGLEAARRSLWGIGVYGLTGPVMATGFVLQRGSPDFGVWLAVFGTLWLVAGFAAMVYLGTRRLRLDALDDTPTAPATAH